MPIYAHVVMCNLQPYHAVSQKLEQLHQHRDKCSLMDWQSSSSLSTNSDSSTVCHTVHVLACAVKLYTEYTEQADILQSLSAAEGYICNMHSLKGIIARFSVQC